MGYELEGQMAIINDIQEFPSGFSKREFVVESRDGQYTQMIKFECIRERTSLTDGFSQGDPVKVHFDIRGNEYNGRYFVNLTAWKLEKTGTSSDQVGASDEPPLTEPPPGYGQDDQDVNDAPF